MIKQIDLTKCRLDFWAWQVKCENAQADDLNRFGFNSIHSFKGYDMIFKQEKIMHLMYFSMIIQMQIISQAMNLMHIKCNSCIIVQIKT